MNVLAGWLRVALLDLRGDLRHFGVLLACLALGVGTIAAVGSVGEALQAAIARDARIVLGGDLEAQLSYRKANADERALFDGLGTVAEVIDVAGRLRGEGGSGFVSIKAVDERYPLLGTVDMTTPEGGTLSEVLATRDAVPGILVDSLLIDRMQLEPGDRVQILDGEFEVRGTLNGIPDQVTQGFQLGAPVLMTLEGLETTNILKPGVLAGYRYKVVFNSGVIYEDAQRIIFDSFEDAAWEVRSPQEATETLAELFSVFSRFLIIVGLSSLLVGGVGVSNAVAGYISERQRSIATMRSLGATSARIMVHFLAQILLLTVAGIVIGLALGASLSLVALPIIGSLLNIQLDAAVHAPALLTATGFGLLVGFAFAYLPLARARMLRPALLFRSAGASIEGGWRWRDLLRADIWIPLFLAGVGLIGLALLTTRRPELVFWYAFGAIVAFVVLRLAAAALQWLLRLVPPLPNANLRNALKAIHRPGAPAPAVILSLGLGLALLLLIALVDNNLRGQFERRVTEEAPTFVFMDMFPDEAEEIEALSQSDQRIEDFYSTPMMRAAIVSMAGKPTADYEPYPRELQFIMEGESPITWLDAFPEGSSKLIEGEWWPTGYDGPPLVSLSVEFRDGMGLKIGDPFEIMMFGETLTATIANFRQVDWTEDVNFAITFSPGQIEQFPVSHLGMLKVREGEERAVQTMLIEDYPLLVFIPVGDALAMLTRIFRTMTDAVSIVGGLAVVSGVFVLAGAMAAGRAQREADAVVMKVLGATRGDVIRAYLIEYGVLGALSALLATLLGIAGAWGFVTQVLEFDFWVDPLLIVTVITGAVALTIATGMLMTWTALSSKPAGYLRGE
jgi:putative ABC transport system permease protein